MSKPLFDEMESLCEQHPVNILALQQREVKAGAYQEKMREFVDRLQDRR